MCIRQGNEKFQKGKCAYFLPKMRGKGSFKPITFFSSTPLREKKGKPSGQNEKRYIGRGGRESYSDSWLHVMANITTGWDKMFNSVSTYVLR